MGSFRLLVIFCVVATTLLCNISLLTGASSTLHPQLQKATSSATTGVIHSMNRKLIQHGICTNRDVIISQSRSSTVGIPQFIVQIVNTCISSCSPSNIHVHCGWFASAKMVNPKTFKRLSFDDCLVNGGRPLMNSEMIRFTYSNSFMYQLSFKSAKFC